MLIFTLVATGSHIYTVSKRGHLICKGLITEVYGFFIHMFLSTKLSYVVR